MNYYGFGSPNEVKKTIKYVCSKFHTADRRVPMVSAIIAVETQFGTYPDNSINVGVGITQFDPVRFYDVKKRIKQKYKDLVLREFGVDVNLVGLCCLRYNILLSIIFTVLALLLIKEALPWVMEGIYYYWKKYWNTSAGKGTKEHFYQSYYMWKHLIEE